MASMIEQHQVAPSPGSAAELTLPLTYFDHVWLPFHRMRRILFYKLPISKTSFVETIIPSLKDSLSLTLKHYLPLAGNVVCPVQNSSGYPELRYVTGDSVSVTFSETDMDFDFLIGNHLRDAKDFYSLVPKLADPKDAPGIQLAPLLAIQVTLFPNLGMSIGFTNHHVVADGATIVWFIKSWALLNKFGGDELLLPDELIPFYDRSVIKDPNGQCKSIWDLVTKYYKVEMCDNVTPPHDKVRGTFILGRDDIGKLKNLILSRQSSLTHVTSFVVTCAYIWTCLKKSEAAIGEEIDETAVEFFGCAADCRARFNPPLPPTYFGNCIVGYLASTKHADLVGKEGFKIAVELIREAIQKRIMDEQWILSGEWLKAYIDIMVNRSLSVAGSPKLDLYAADFGWGKSVKVEFVSIDSDDGISMSLIRSRDSEGDLEVGLSLPKIKMNAFAAIFAHGLSML